MKKAPQKIPLFIVLVVSFVTLNVLAVTLVGYLSYRNGQHAVNDVVHQLRGEITTRIEEHLRTFLNTPRSINATNAGLLRQGLLSADDATSLEQHFRQQIQIFTSVSSIYFGNIRGGLVNAGREEAEGEFSIIITDDFKKGPLKKYGTDQQGQRTKLLMSLPDFDAGSRPWYRNAIARDGEVWSKPYILFTGQDMAIATSQPVYDSQQQLLGVVSVDLFLSHLGKFLQSLTIGENGYAFIMDRSGLLVASSSAERPFTDFKSGIEQRQLHAGESDVPLIRRSAQVLSAAFGDHRQITGEQHLEFDIDGERQFLQVTSVPSEDNLDWLVIVVLPQADFMTKISRNNRTTAILALFTLIITAAIGIVTAGKTTGPIMELKGFTESLSRGEWGKTIADRSRISEVSAMTDAYNHLSRELQQMVAELKAEIIERRLVEEQLRESNNHFKASVTEAPIPMILVDAEGNITLFNNKFSEQFGYTLQDIKTAEQWWQTVYPDPAYREKVRNSWEKAIAVAMRIGREIDMQEWTITAKDGSLRRVEFKMTPLGKTSVITMNDISERIQAENERLKLRKLESVGVLAGGIAHDFNNLLTGLFGNIDMARRLLPSDHKASIFLESAGRSMEGAINLTKQLLTFARGGAPIKETLSIGEVIAETAQFLIRGSTIRVESIISPELWPVEADKGQLSQVISNLVINAQQAMPDGGTITIVAENVETWEGRYITLTVADQGCGIPPGHLDKIFDPYFSTKAKGSGLGLASAHSIITKHNGRITVQSQPGKGTVFTIFLPASTTPLPSPGISGDSTAADTAAAPPSAARILVMDDEESVRDVIGAILESFGYVVSFAVDGRSAVAAYRKACSSDTPFDLVITDLTIPGGMGGQEAAAEIIKIDPEAKIIVSSGYATDSVMADYREYGFSARITKPYRVEELEKTIQLVLSA